MLCATVCFAVMHTSIRHVASGIHPFEVSFFRCAFGFLAIVPWLVRSGIAPLRTRQLPLHLLRAVVGIGGMLAYFTALAIAPLAEVTALSFLAPLAATLLAAVFLKESVGWRRWTAIGVGFVGTVIVLRPGFATIEFGQMLALMSVGFSAFGLIMVKILGRKDSSVTLTAYMSILMAPMMLVPAWFHWTWPTPTEWVWLAMIGIIGNIGQILMAQSLKEADTAAAVPFDFFRLVWIAAIAYVAFGEVPGLFSWIGGAVIFAAGTYLAIRERRLAEARARERARSKAQALAAVREDANPGPDSDGDGRAA